MCLLFCQVWAELQNSLKDTFVKNYQFNLEKTKEIDKMQKEVNTSGKLQYMLNMVYDTMFNDFLLYLEI